jgi:purine-cytosine permease-like protein
VVKDMNKWGTVVFREITINMKYIFPLLHTYVKYMPEQKRIWLLFKENFFLSDFFMILGALLCKLVFSYSHKLS